MSHQPASDEMVRQLRTAWFTYVDTIEPVRPALYRYCRRLTGDVWEAEDLLQEPLLRAAVVLKDIFDFTAGEIAVMLSTTVGAVKSALHRGRTNLQKTPHESHASPRAPSRELIDRVVAAFKARDVDGITNLLLENVTLDVPGVGGERGKNMIWVRASLSHPSFRSDRLLYQGERIGITWDEQGAERVLVGVTRFEEQDRAVALIREYAYCPETINEVAAELGVKAATRKYHQDPATLQRTVAASDLPWTKAV